MEYNSAKFPVVVRGVSGLIYRAEANYLNQVADRLGEGIYVDLGTFRGRSAVCIADGIRRNNLKNSKVITIDMFDRRGLSNRFAKDPWEVIACTASSSQRDWSRLTNLKTNPKSRIKTMTITFFGLPFLKKPKLIYISGLK